MEGIIKCGKCQFEIPSNFEECSDFLDDIIGCENNNCEVSFKLRDYKEHRNVCEHKVITCVCGEWKGYRRDLKPNHSDKCLNIQAELVLQEVKNYVEIKELFTDRASDLDRELYKRHQELINVEKRIHMINMTEREERIKRQQVRFKKTSESMEFSKLMDESDLQSVLTFYGTHVNNEFKVRVMHTERDVVECKLLMEVDDGTLLTKLYVKDLQGKKSEDFVVIGHMYVLGKHEPVHHSIHSYLNTDQCVEHICDIEKLSSRDGDNMVSIIMKFMMAISSA